MMFALFLLKRMTLGMGGNGAIEVDQCCCDTYTPIHFNLHFGDGGKFYAFVSVKSLLVSS